MKSNSQKTTNIKIHKTAEVSHIRALTEVLERVLKGLSKDILFEVSDNGFITFRNYGLLRVIPGASLILNEAGAIGAAKLWMKQFNEWRMGQREGFAGYPANAAANFPDFFHKRLEYRNAVPVYKEEGSHKILHYWKVNYGLSTAEGAAIADHTVTLHVRHSGGGLLVGLDYHALPLLGETEETESALPLTDEQLKKNLIYRHNSSLQMYLPHLITETGVVPLTRLGTGERERRSEHKANIWIKCYNPVTPSGRTPYNPGLENIYDIILKRLNKIQGITAEMQENYYKFGEYEKIIGGNKVYSFMIKWDGFTKGFPQRLAAIFNRANPTIVFGIGNYNPQKNNSDMGVNNYTDRFNRDFYFFKRIFTDDKVSDLYILYLLTHEFEETISLANNGWNQYKNVDLGRFIFKYNSGETQKEVLLICYNHRDHIKGLRAEVKAFVFKKGININPGRVYQAIANEKELMKLICYELYGIPFDEDLDLGTFSFALTTEGNVFTYEAKGIIGYPVSNISVIVEPPRLTEELIEIRENKEKFSEYKEKLKMYLKTKVPRFILNIVPENIENGGVWRTTKFFYLPPSCIGRKDNGDFEIVNYNNLIDYE